MTKNKMIWPINIYLTKILYIFDQNKYQKKIFHNKINVDLTKLKMNDQKIFKFDQIKIDLTNENREYNSNVKFDQNEMIWPKRGAM